MMSSVLSIEQKKKIQMSETIRVGSILALSGGVMDAYTYLYRDQVFANAQTGNIILFGINISEGNWSLALRYFCPVFSFALGVFLAQLLRMHYKNKPNLHWRQIAIFLEVVILFAVSFIGTEYNLVANSLVSFACGIQVQTFRKIHGNSLATTMCIGNLRSATDLLCNYLHTKDKMFLRKSLLYYGVIFLFLLGAVMGNIGMLCFGAKGILISTVFLIIVFFMMIIEEK